MRHLTSHDHLLANHVEFLARQRGRLRTRSGYRFIDSDRKAFRIAIMDDPEKAGRDISEAEAIFLPPWAATAASGRDSSVYVADHQLRHMTIATDALAKARPAGESSSPTAEPVENRRCLEEFTHVQTAAFSDSEADYDEWLDWLSRMNDRAMSRPNHDFWLLRENGTAVSCLITVRTLGLIGIYGVGTLPGYRRRGHSSGLLRHVMKWAAGKRIRVAALQVVVGSHAEEFYANLGFETAFVVDVLKRKPS